MPTSLEQPSRRSFIRDLSLGTVAGFVLADSLKATRAGESVGAAGQSKGAHSAGPEILVVSKLAAGHPMIRSLASQLLERGIFFAHNDRQELPAKLPEDFESYRVVALDGEVFAEVAQQPEVWKKLERFGADQGLVFRLIVAADGAPKASSVTYDIQNDEQVGMMALHGTLTAFHAGLERRQLARSDRTILGELSEENFKRVGSLRTWGEFNNHYWWPARALAESGDATARDNLMKAIRECSATMPTGVLGQSVAGLWGPSWLFRQTGEKEPLNRAVKILDRIVEKRPRTMGVLNWNGFTDDPLGSLRSTKDTGMGWEQPTVSMRAVNWAEALHMQCGPLAAATAATGDDRYLTEALRLIDHFGQHNVDPKDGLAFHGTRDGKPISGKWGRAQTHALYGMLFTVEEMNQDDPRRRRVLDVIARMGAGLRRVQDEATGLWPNEPSVASSRLESSCTAGIVCVYGRCITQGWLSKDDFQDMVRKGWQGLKRMYWRAGLAAQCRGTALGSSRYYVSRPQGWAPVPQLLMAAAIMSHLS